MKKLEFLLLITCNFQLTTFFAQTQFQLAVGGTGVDDARSIIRTTDGGYAVAGNTSSLGAGSNDLYIVKLDGSGSLQWNRTVGGTSNDYALSIVQTSDGGYAVCGATSSFGAGNLDMYIVKLSGSGTLQWSRTIGGAGHDYPQSIIQTADGGYALAGYTESFGVGGSQDFYIVKLDAGGSLQWSRTFGGPNPYLDHAYSIIQTTDGGYAVAGETSLVAGNSDIYIVRLDSNGTLQWNRVIGGANNDRAYSIIQTTDGGYALAGITGAVGLYDFYIAKLDTNGAPQWSKRIGGTGGDWAYSIIQTIDGGYSVAGLTPSFGAGNDDMYIVKLDVSGTLQWSKTVGATGSDGAQSIIQTTDGGYTAAGQTASFGAGGQDFYIVKLDASGNTCGNSSSPTSTVTTPSLTVTTPTPIVTTPTPTITTPTTTTGTGGTVTTICTIVGIQPVNNQIPNQFSLYQNYPNPFNPTTKIRFALPKSSFAKIVVYDALGREMETLVNEQLDAGTYMVDWNAAQFASGVYYYKLISGEFTETGKAVLIK